MSLEERRKRGDLIQYFKIARCFEDVEWTHKTEQPSSLRAEGPAGATRGHKQRLKKQHFSSRDMNDRRAAISERLNFITNRIVPAWISMPAEAINAGSVNAFKAR